MTSATEKLRRMLDERGVKWEAPKSACADLQTFFNVGRLYVTADSLWYDKERLGISMNDTLTPEQAIAATLGRGTLTAEDVRSFLNRNSVFDDTTWPHGRQELVFDEDNLQAMADDLNATLGRGTCHDVWQDDPFANFKCSECNEELHYRDKKRIACCPFCKREVVS